MSDRIAAELELLHHEWPRLDHRAGDVTWVLIPDYPLPGGWSGDPTVAVAFRIPRNPGEQPYGFWTDRPLTHLDKQPGNYTHPIPQGTVPFPGDWAQFSWAPETWNWAENVAAGANMTHYARSFADRFASGA